MGSRLVALSSVVAARGVTLPDIHCVIIHPYTRQTRLHQSGLEALGHELLDDELRCNMEGRAGRAREGIVFYLFEHDDSEALKSPTKTSKRHPRKLGMA